MVLHNRATTTKIEPQQVQHLRNGIDGDGDRRPLSSELVSGPGRDIPPHVFADELYGPGLGDSHEGGGAVPGLGLRMESWTRKQHMPFFEFTSIWTLHSITTGPQDRSIWTPPCVYRTLMMPSWGYAQL